MKVAAAVCAVILGLAGTAQAKELNFRHNGANVKVDVVDMKMKDALKCSADRLKIINAKATEVAKAKVTPQAIEAGKAQGYDITKKGAYIRFVMGYSCFKNFMGLKLDSRPPDKHAYFYYYDKRAWEYR